jgi:undecaprenyl-diphosphatase
MKHLNAILGREERVERSLAAGLVTGGVLAAALGWLVRSVIWKAHGGLDRDLTISIRRHHSEARTKAAHALSALAHQRLIVPGSLLTIGLLLRAKHKVSAALFTSSVLGGFLLSTTLKISFRRARPALWPALATEETYSFPSGHATLATVFYGGLAAVTFHLSPSRFVRAGALVSAGALVTGLGASRVYLGAHWTTDVVGGTLLGLSWEAFCLSATEALARRY